MLSWPGVTKRKFATFIVALSSAAALQVFSTGSATAELWKKAGGWVVVRSENLGGCTMATRYSSGAFLSVTVVSRAGAEPLWEIYVADQGWAAVRGNHNYPVDVHMLGTFKGVRHTEMQGVSAADSSGLMASFPQSSEFADFVSKGMDESTHIAFAFGDNLMGSYSLRDADLAYGELLDCFGKDIS